MKNLPETNFWNSIKARLENYQEVPADDAWDKIAGAIPPGPSRRNKVKKGIGLAALFLAGTLTGVGLNQYFSGMNDQDSQSSSNKAQVDTFRSLSDATADHSNDTRTKDSVVERSTAQVNQALPDDGALASFEKNERHPAISKKPVIGNRFIDKENHNGLQEPDRQQQITNEHNTSTADVDKTSETRNTVSRESADALNREEVGRTNSSATGVNSNVVVKQTVDDADHAEAVTTLDDKGSDEIQENASKRGLKNDLQQTSSDQNKVDREQQEKKLESTKVGPEKKPEALRKPRILKGANVYAIITPTLSFQRITPSKRDDIEVIDFESPGVMSKERLGWSFDVGYQGLVKRNLEWYGGLSYYQQQQTLTYRYKTGEFEMVSTGKGHVMVPKVSTHAFAYNMRNLGVSAGLLYTIKHGGLQHQFGAGLQFQSGLAKSGSEQSYNNASTTYFNYQLSYRLQLAIKPQWTVFLQPTFVHSILANESLTEPFELKPYRAGIGIGAIYRF